MKQAKDKRGNCMNPRWSLWKGQVEEKYWGCTISQKCRLRYFCHIHSLEDYYTSSWEMDVT